MINSAWIILFLPLLAAILITFLWGRNSKLSAHLSIGAVAISFVLSLVLFIFLAESVHAPRALESSPFTWLAVGNLRVDFALRLDALSLLMLLIVTGVGGMIHIYSYSYMEGDPGYARYFAGLSFFTFAMLGILLANNFVMLFIFWELVGFASYFLIGFWYERSAAADAASAHLLPARFSRSMAQQL